MTGGNYNYELIKSKEAQELLKSILVINPEKRATLDEMLQSNWITNNGKEIIELKQVEYDKTDDKGTKSGFGNLSRLLQ